MAVNSQFFFLELMEALGEMGKTHRFHILLYVSNDLTHDLLRNCTSRKMLVSKILLKQEIP